MKDQYHVLHQRSVSAMPGVACAVDLTFGLSNTLETKPVSTHYILQLAHTLILSLTCHHLATISCTTSYIRVKRNNKLNPKRVSPGFLESTPPRSRETINMLRVPSICIN